MNSAYQMQKTKGWNKWWKATAIVIALLAIVAIAVLLFVTLKPKPFVTKEIKRQTGYTIFKPAEASGITADQSSVSYDSSIKLLNYNAIQQDTNIKLTFSLQATPESFVDIPQAYDKFTESLHPYTTFDSIQGKVYLTKPTELKGSQSAVMNAKGTLMFIKPDKNLSDDAWKLLFSNLEIAQ